MRSIVYNNQAPDGPKSLLEGVERAVCQTLAITALAHRSALLKLCQSESLPSGSVAALYNQMAANWQACRALRPSAGSLQNWRWRAPQLAIAAHNTSPEVVLERAIVAACERRGRQDWSNQVPVASGVAGPHGERRRAIDLVHQTGPGAFQLIELKVGSDTPLYAAFEIIAYTAVWLLSRTERGRSAEGLLAADRIEAIVLAPEAYYARYRLAPLHDQLNAELAALGEAHGVALSFAFEGFDDGMARSPFTDDGLMQLIDGRRRL